jgi:phospholipid/cholesterol/gamma-HCH transport system permease protein
MPEAGASLSERVEGIGRGTTAGVEWIGHGAMILYRSFYWLLLGSRRGQRVAVGSVFTQMWEIGIGALPIVSMLALAIGIMLSIQGVQVLRQFGAEQQLVVGASLSIVREFGPLITAILVAGRTGSALAARLASMTINNEISALEVMGINPVRYLVVPSLLAMAVMLPMLTIWSDAVGLIGAGAYATLELGTGMQAWIDGTLRALDADDILHGLSKSALFAFLIVIIGVLNGLTVKGGAEGVGRVTTRAVVQSISAIVLTDMVFAFATTR